MNNGYTLHITNAPPDWHEKLYALVSQLPADTLTSEAALTIQNAFDLFDRVTLDARHLLRLAVQGNGRALGADFRSERGEGRLNGATTSLTRQVKALTKQGRWPESIPEVLTSTKAGPEGYRKTHAFHMPATLVPVFRAAIHQHDKGSTGNPQAVLDHLTLLYEEIGRGEQAQRFAEQFLEGHADDLAAWLAQRASVRTLDTAPNREGEAE